MRQRVIEFTVESLYPSLKINMNFYSARVQIGIKLKGNIREIVRPPWRIKNTEILSLFYPSKQAMHAMYRTWNRDFFFPTKDICRICYERIRSRERKRLYVKLAVKSMKRETKSAEFKWRVQRARASVRFGLRYIHRTIRWKSNVW